MNRNDTSLRILLHVGAPKCGSSALQKFLSFNPILETTSGIRYFYLARDPVTGKIISGKKLPYMAKSCVTGYLNLGNGNLRDHFDNLNLSEKYGFDPEKDILVVSSEWFFFCNHTVDADRFIRTFFKGYHVFVDLLIYIRPQVQLINSGWWQWAAWGNSTIDEYIELCTTDWHAYEPLIKKYKEVPYVKNTFVRLLPKDIVSDFCYLFQIPCSRNTHSQVINKSLPGILLRLYQKHPSLRPNEHASEIDFALEKYLGDIDSPTPWVLSPMHVAKIKDAFYATNKIILHYLSEDQKSEMENDKRWWYPELKRSYSDASPVALDPSGIENLAFRSCQHIYALDKELNIHRALVDLFIQLYENIIANNSTHQVSANDDSEEFIVAIADHLALLSKHFFSLGELNNAVEKVSAALKFNDGNSFYHHHLASLLQARGDMDGAEAAELKAIHLSGDMPEFYMQLSHIYNNKSELDKAITFAKKAIVLDSKNARFHHHLGNMLRKKGDLDGAVTAQQKAIELLPEFYAPHFQLSHIYNQKCETQKAIDEARRAISLNQENANLYLHLGILLRINNDLDGADSILRKAISLSPKLPGPHFQLSQVFNQKGETSNAIDEANIAVSLDRDNASIHHFLGILLRKTGDLDGAEKHQNIAIQINNGIANPHFQLSCIYKVRNETENAISEAKIAIALNPLNQDFQRHLDKLVEIEKAQIESDLQSRR